MSIVQSVRPDVCVRVIEDVSAVGFSMCTEQIERTGRHATNGVRGGVHPLPIHATKKNFQLLR